MKKLTLLFTGITLLALVACSNLISDVHKDDVIDDIIIMKLSLGEETVVRTALPVVDTTTYESFTKFVLEGDNSFTTITWQTDATSSAYAKMSAAEIAVSQGTTYNFTLTATAGSAHYTGTKQITIGASGNVVSFDLRLSSLTGEDGISEAGEFKIDLTLPSNGNVATVEAAVYAVGADGKENGSPVVAQRTLALSNNSSSYTGSVTNAGSYVALFDMYSSDGTYLGSYREYLGIANGLKSTSEVNISSTANLYTITYDTQVTGKGTYSHCETGSGNVQNLATPTATGDSNITFDGWNTQSNWSGSVNTTTENLAGGDVNLYAQYSVTYAITGESSAPVFYLDFALGDVGENQVNGQ